jgi:hypothetical protein
MRRPWRERGLRLQTFPSPVDEVMELPSASLPAASVAARRGERAARQLDRQRAGRGLHGDGPGAVADGDVPAGVDEAWARDREHLRRTVRRVALADPAEVEPHAVVELDHPAVDAHFPAACAGLGLGTVGCDRLEGPVVPGGDDGVMDRRIETPSGVLACREGELGHAQEVGTGVEPAGAVQERELRVLSEAREDRLESVELVLRGGERGGGAARVDEEVDLRAHRPERAPLHHEVLVTVSGGNETTRTDGAEAAASCARCAAEICACRCFSCTR